MPLRSVLTTTLFLAAGATAFGVFVDRRADLREAGIEARYPAVGRTFTVAGRDVHLTVRGAGPDLVLIHGAGGSNREFDFDFANRLAERYRVFAVDRPGFGWSERLRDDLTGVFTTAAESPLEQARTLAEAVRLAGAERPLVLGHSYGGAVAMAWALEQPAAGIVILSGATMPWPGGVDWTYRLLGSLPGGAALPPIVSAFIPRSYVEQVLEAVFAPQPVPEGYLKQAGVMMATRIATLRANARQVNTLRPHVVEMSARYGEIALPVEILHGTADKTVYKEVHAEPLAALLPNAALTILDGVGHMPHHAAPQAVIDAIDRAATRAGLRQAPTPPRYP